MMASEEDHRESKSRDIREPPLLDVFMSNVFLNSDAFLAAATAAAADAATAASAEAADVCRQYPEQI